MARLFDKRLEHEPEGVKCALWTCGSPIKDDAGVYDDRTEEYFCDRQCFEEYLYDNLGEFADWYAGLNLYDLS